MSPPTPPPLTRWGHVWRYLLTILISAFAWSELAVWQWQNARVWFWLDLVIGLAALVIVGWRRRFPVTVATVTALASAASGSVGGPATLALFSLATRRRWREILPLAVLAFVCGLLLIRVEGPPQVDAVVVLPTMAAVIGVTIGWGMFVGSRRELMQTLRERARTAETEQEARVAQARTTERARIAREMHDVLAHRISLVTMHAGALTYRRDLSSEQVHETAGLIRDTAHQALTDLREVLGVLREDSGDATPELPQPDASDLPALFEEARRNGMHLQVETCDVSLGDVPPTIGRAAYRVIQEGLTNARKHAPDTLVSVTVTGRAGEELRVQVRNHLLLGETLGVPVSGLGLVGLRERAELAGGRLSHRVEDHTFVLEVTLPWPT
ncbi:sensor histidine kinase [Aeromicrobium sp. CTD01-1L150]|uniref:sensor histidine kinase n=1 Tax=Aeromicrobium sp. CTD01-1L150 TaxID=3341830 RepID=UPI0035BEDE65